MDTKDKILSCSLTLFSEKGFDGVSVREIAKSVGVRESALYKHFKNKDEMFSSLVEPAMNGFYDLYHMIESEYFDNTDPSELQGERFDWESKSEAVRAVTYIYDHLDEFKLIILKASGTRYEDFVHRVAKLEEDVTYRYMDLLKEKGYKIKKTNPRDFHLLLTSFVEAMFMPITHGLNREEALQYAETMEEFYNPAWKEWLGI